MELVSPQGSVLGVVRLQKNPTQAIVKYQVVIICFTHAAISNHGCKDGTPNGNPITLALIGSCVKIVPFAAVSNHRGGVCDLI
jgi:hypothetical protein